jgi:hypothetical protein
MNKKKPVIDYSSDNIFDASEKVASMSLKNIQPPPMIQQSDVANPVQPTSNNPILQPSASNPVSEFMKQLKGLNNNLDATLKDLDALWNEVPYPRVNLQNKQNHNPRFDQTYEGQNYGNNQVGRGLSGGTLDQDTMQSMTRAQLYAYCTSNNIPVPNGYQRTTKNELMNILSGYGEADDDEPDTEANTIESGNVENYNDEDENIDHWLEETTDSNNSSSDLEYDDAYDDGSNVTSRTNPMNSDGSINTVAEDDNDNTTLGEPQDVYEKLMTGDLMEISNRLSNLQVQFSSYVNQFSIPYNRIKWMKLKAN